MTRKIRTLIADDEELARERIRRLLASEADIEIVGEPANGAEAVEAIREFEPDLVFLDIQMPELDGFEVLEQIGAESLPLIIFVTAYDEYALKAFEFHAVDYVLKPCEPERLLHATERARCQLRTGVNAKLDEKITALLRHVNAGRKFLDRILIKSVGRVIFVHTDDIVWIGAEGNYLRINTTRESHLMRETMNRIEARLDTDKFIRIHRSTLVRIDQIKELKPMLGGEYAVTLTDDTQFTLSRTYRDKFLQIFGNMD